MAQTLHNLIETIQARLGHAPSCAWVEERLAAYCDWDLPEHEFLAVERHLAGCPACTRAYGNVAPLVSSIQEQDLRAQFPGFSSAQFAAATMAMIDTYERARAAGPMPPAPFCTRPRLVRLAAACTVLCALVALALLLVRSSADAGASGPAVVAGTPDGGGGTALSANESTPGQAFSAEPGAPEGEARTSSGLPDLGLREGLEADVSRVVEGLDADALLPQTDQELDAWACHEYPDVMWFCDLLCREFSYCAPRQELLRKSDTLLRFDWPTAVNQPSRRPSMAAVWVAASFAGCVLSCSRTTADTSCRNSCGPMLTLGLSERTSMACRDGAHGHRSTSILQNRRVALKDWQALPGSAKRSWCTSLRRAQSLAQQKPMGSRANV